MPLILEGVVTTVNSDGSPNIAPMGPIVDRDLSQLTLRPFNTSQTYANLRRTGEGVLHVTDDVELMARAAVNELPTPKLMPAKSVTGLVLADACRWYEFRVRELDDSQARTRIRCDVVDQGHLREFFGFNRAKHAVIELAILATRVDLLPAEQIRGDLERLSIIVEKTAGEQEERAFEFLMNYLRERLKA